MIKASSLQSLHSPPRPIFMCHYFLMWYRTNKDCGQLCRITNMRLDIKCWGTLWSLLSLPHGCLIIILCLSHTMTCNCFRMSSFSACSLWSFIFLPSGNENAMPSPPQYSCPKVVEWQFPHESANRWTDGWMEGHTQAGPILYPWPLMRERITAHWHKCYT